MLKLGLPFPVSALSIGDSGGGEEACSGEEYVIGVCASERRGCSGELASTDGLDRRAGNAIHFFGVRTIGEESSDCSSDTSGVEPCSWGEERVGGSRCSFMRFRVEPAMVSSAPDGGVKALSERE